VSKDQRNTVMVTRNDEGQATASWHTHCAANNDT